MACIATLLALIFLEPSYGPRVRAWLSPALAPEANAPDLAAENEALKAEIAKLASVAAELPQTPRDYQPAMVYSRYPLNFKNELMIDAGSRDGIVAGKAAVFRGILIGSVLQVFSDSALVQTVFDSDFKMPVRIGKKGYDALLVGGAYPKATSIEKTAMLAPGDIVYAAASGTPYGMPIAIIESTSTSPDNLFEEAGLGFAYDVNGIQTLFIAR